MKELSCYTRPESMTPLLPDHLNGMARLEALAYSLSTKAHELKGCLNPITCEMLKDSIGYGNSYYSNLIEGNPTHPISMEKAMKEGIPVGATPELQRKMREATTHMHAQREVDKWIKDMCYEDVFSSNFIRQIHHELYQGIPEGERVVKALDSDLLMPIIPGEFRTHPVQVGRHVPFRAEDLERAFVFFQNGYTLPENKGGVRRIVAIACAHHRLAWIHPFSDGNGRVTRIFTHAALVKAGLDGPWSINRGLARAHRDYKAKLAYADMARQGDSDGRGNLSSRALGDFAEFFLQCALDQVEFSEKFLRLPTWLERVQRALEIHESGEIRKVAKQAFRVLRECILMGEVPRGEVKNIIQKSDRTATALIALLGRHELVQSVGPKMPLRIGLSQKMLEHYFPAFLPEISVS